MAEDYRTDSEQVELLKSWWRQYGRLTVMIVALVVVLIFVWQAWQSKRQQAKEYASTTYQQLLMAASANEGQPDERQMATAHYLAGNLQNDFPQLAYATFAAFYEAQWAVQANDLPAAAESLQWVIDNQANPYLLALAQLRLARVLSAQGDYTTALAQLDQASNSAPPAYAANYAEVRGDIYTAQHNYAAALTAYQTAIDLQVDPLLADPLLALKLQHIISRQGAVVENEAETTNE